MGYLLVVLAVVLVPVVAQNNRSLSFPSTVGQVSRRVDQLFDHVSGGFAVVNERLNQLSNHLSHRVVSGSLTPNSLTPSSSTILALQLLIASHKQFRGVLGGGGLSPQF